MQRGLVPEYSVMRVKNTNDSLGAITSMLTSVSSSHTCEMSDGNPWTWERDLRAAG